MATKKSKEQYVVLFDDNSICDPGEGALPISKAKRAALKAEYDDYDETGTITICKLVPVFTLERPPAVFKPVK